MKKFLNATIRLAGEIIRYPAFYFLIIILCPVLYLLFLWLETVGTAP